MDTFKAITMALFLVFANTARGDACIDLAGDYICDSKGGWDLPFNLSIRQSTFRGVDSRGNGMTKEVYIFSKRPYGEGKEENKVWVAGESAGCTKTMFELPYYPDASRLDLGGDRYWILADGNLLVQRFYWGELGGGRDDDEMLFSRICWSHPDTDYKN